MEERDAPGLLGRAAAWRRAVTVLDRAAAGVGGVLLVSGEAGIGKTAFCDAVLLAAKRDGWTTAWAAAAPVATVPGLWPWRRLLASIDGGDLPHQQAGDGDRGAARLAQFDAILRRVEVAAIDAPVLIVLDDAHWADPPTLAMVLHFATASRGVRACLVVALRPEDAGAGSPLGEVLPGLRRLSTEVALTPLDRGDVAALASQVAGREPIADDVLDALVHATGGNPLFVSEMASRLGGPELPSLRGAAPAPSPAIASIVAERVARLSPPCRELVAAAAVIGTDAGMPILARVLGRDPTTVLPAADEACGAGVLRRLDGGELAFRHPLFQSAVYDALPHPTPTW